MNRFTYIFIAFIFMSGTAFAQEMKTVSGTVKYVCPKSMSQEESEFRAVENAKLKILADTYGTLVGTITTTAISDGISKTYEVGESEVKGEWITTIGDPKIDKELINNEIVITVHIKGIVKEIINNEIDLSIKTLRNGTESKFQSTTFTVDDDLFVSFKSPVSGYLAIYLNDPTGVYCLLPYTRQPEGIYPIEKGIDYCFFSIKNAKQAERYYVDELVMSTDKKVEYDRLYFIFSQAPFTKANDTQVDSSLPRFLEYQDYQKWLLKLRKRDKTMTVKTVDITITNK